MARQPTTESAGWLRIMLASSSSTRTVAGQASAYGTGNKKR